MWRAPDLGGLELLRANYERFVFTPHAHEEFMIAVTERGVGEPIFRGDKHPVRPGDILVLNPEQAHAGGPAIDAAWGYRALYPGRALLCSVSAEFDGAKSVLPEFDENVVRDGEIAYRLRRFHVIAERADSTQLERETILVEALVGLTARHATRRESPRSPGRESRPVRLAREYLEEHPQENDSLVALARTAGLSPFHLCRVFRRELGLTPHTYQTEVRIRTAKKLLNQGMSIAMAAAESGFYDQAHLTRHFKRHVGVTPGKYVAGKGN
jgi:AraC-like DNA-binding protein